MQKCENAKRVYVLAEYLFTRNFSVRCRTNTLRIMDAMVMDVKFVFSPRRMQLQSTAD